MVVLLISIFLHIKKCIVILLVLSTAFSTSAQLPPKYTTTILLIPLDDRPPCLQFTQKMGLIGDAKIITPPKEYLGWFTTPGQSDKIIDWIKKQDLKSFDAAIVSLDMIVYGGLVGSRVHNVKYEDAIKRIGILSEIKRKAPKLPVYAQSVIMRLAPTADGKNEAYRAKLSKWAEVSVAADEASKAETVKLEGEIPAAALADYKKARERNLQINLKGIDFVRSGVMDYLILSQDDAKPAGIHVADREKLVAEIKRSGLTGKIAVQPGADEVSMLLLARALNAHYKLNPTIKAVYSSEAVANTIMPFEDKPLKQTVSYHISATGSREVQDEKDADLLFYVFATRHDNGSAVSFADAIEEKIKSGKRILVADIDPIGDVQGGDSVFTNELGRRGLLPELYSYASWNTAANTIGTTVPQGITFALANNKLVKNSTRAARIWTAQNWFLFHRVLDDYYFHGLLRSKINTYFAQNKASSNHLSAAVNSKVEAYGSRLLREAFDDFTRIYSQRRDNSIQKNVQCGQPGNMSFKLPWNRTFEAEIDFDMRCSLWH